MGVYLYDKFLKVECLHQIAWAFVTVIHIAKLPSTKIFQSTHPPAWCVITHFHIPQSDTWNIRSHCYIKLHLSYYEQPWAFPIFNSHLHFLCTVLVCCPFFYWLSGTLLICSIYIVRKLALCDVNCKCFSQVTDPSLYFL